MVICPSKGVIAHRRTFPKCPKKNEGVIAKKDNLEIDKMTISVSNRDSGAWSQGELVLRMASSGYPPSLRWNEASFMLYYGGLYQGNGN